MHDVDVHVRWLSAGIGRRASSAEARGGEIERAPPELDRARFSEEIRAEAFEQDVRLQESRRETSRVIAVVWPDVGVLRERDRDRDLAGDQVDVRVGNSESGQRSEHL